MVFEKQKKTMNSREKILEQIRLNKPESGPELPQTSLPEAEDLDLKSWFAASLQSVGGTIVEVADLEKALEKRTAGLEKVLCLPPGYTHHTRKISTDSPADTLATLDLLVVQARLGVAENGAVWMTEDELNGRRILPFIAAYVVVLLRESDLVANMHAAYACIRISENGFGVFLSGPSKTADIEQSLVIGAHGARGLEVWLMA